MRGSTFSFFSISNFKKYFVQDIMKQFIDRSELVASFAFGGKEQKKHEVLAKKIAAPFFCPTFLARGNFAHNFQNARNFMWSLGSYKNLHPKP